ncbi:MAG: leucyl/phenylalanyl-tRNA--protein transferase [Alphaproteobacteria bacterium]|nr:leucyl/phenylalanyl-tRNA--protein transferase [Alphaproteobacteria bacterium]
MSELNADILLRAYAAGLFPMAESRQDKELFWVDPEWRGVIPLDEFHMSRRLRRILRNNPFEVRFDSAFAEVMKGCAEPRPGRSDTWINDEIMRLYGDLHAMGRAHSVECWQDGRLVGGLYGVSISAAFFGESMFTRVTNASKIALAYLVAGLIKGGYVLLDTQFLTRHLEQFGAREISRQEYRALLGEALSRHARFQSGMDDSEVLGILQSSTQTS